MKKRNYNFNLKIWRKKTQIWKFRYQRVVLRNTWILLVRKKIIKDFCTFIRLHLWNACRCTLSSVWINLAEEWETLCQILTSNILKCNKCQACNSNNLLTLCSSILWPWAKCKCHSCKECLAKCLWWTVCNFLCPHKISTIDNDHFWLS